MQCSRWHQFPRSQVASALGFVWLTIVNCGATMELQVCCRSTSRVGPITKFKPSAHE